MDTSGQYIEMCRKAVEVQELWKPNIGDYCKTKLLKKCAVIIGIGFYRNPMITVLGIGYTNRRTLKSKSGLTWLPRQDQLQEILGSSCKCELLWLHQIKYLEPHANWCCDFAEDGPIETESYRIIYTWEQFWLSLVMHVKFNKTWKGKDWKAEEENF